MNPAVLVDDNETRIDRGPDAPAFDSRTRSQAEKTHAGGARVFDVDAPGHRASSPLSWGYLVRVGLFTVGVLALAFAANLVVGSRLEHEVAQTQKFDQLRLELAEGTAPVGPHVGTHETLALGTPIALLEVPSIGVKEVVSEGTTGSVLMAGPGHLRTSVFPGGVGTSVILGRSAAYGGPFGRIGSLRRGARIKVTTDVGTAVFRVIDVRTAGRRVPYLPAGDARLTLATARGPAFVPTGMVWVDANLVGSPLAAQRPALERVPPSERPLGTDVSAVGAALGWFVLLVVVLAAGVWTWARRGRPQAWIVFSAPALFAGLMVADRITLLLPNVM